MKTLPAFTSPSQNPCCLLLILLWLPAWTWHLHKVGHRSFEGRCSKIINDHTVRDNTEHRAGGLSLRPLGVSLGSREGSGGAGEGA